MIQTEEKDRALTGETGNTLLLGKGRGCLYGVAIGDAMGAPAEWKMPPQIRERYGPFKLAIIPVGALRSRPEPSARSRMSPVPDPASMARPTRVEMAGPLCASGRPTDRGQYHPSNSAATRPFVNTSQ